MPILFSVIARGTIVLTKHASCAGNFTEVTEQILTKIPPSNGKLTYSHGSYLFHYICENRIIYMCITDDVSIIILLTLLHSLFPFQKVARYDRVHSLCLGNPNFMHLTPTVSLLTITWAMADMLHMINVDMHSLSKLIVRRTHHHNRNSKFLPSVLKPTSWLLRRSLSASLCSKDDYVNTLCFLGSPKIKIRFLGVHLR
jgi:hypothetical protein